MLSFKATTVLLLTLVSQVECQVPLIVDLSQNTFCILPPDFGTCARLGWDGFDRYFFNSTTRQCEKFVYSGCGGNANRFMDEISCETTCGYFYYTVNTVWLPAVDNPNLPQLSLEEMSRRLCTRGAPMNIPSTRTDAIQCGIRRSCPVGYDCVLGPRNYQVIAICCPSKTPPVLSTTTELTLGSQNGLLMRPEWCLLPPTPGPCRQLSTQWYFDINSHKCHQFTYGGCRGNQNRFQTRAQCELICPPLVTLLGTTPEPATVTIPIKDQMEIRNVPLRCTLGPDTGPGLNFSMKYYYEPAIKSCLPFMYGGCQGNGNRFETELACIAVCRPEMAIEAKAEARKKQIMIDDDATPLAPPSFPCAASTMAPRFTVPANVRQVRYFSHPSDGYASCGFQSKCLLEPCQTAKCPAYQNAVCRANSCFGCLAEFYVNNRRVNCSLPGNNADFTLKPGNCPSESAYWPCPDSPLNNNGKPRPQNNLCSADAECFADQKCCVDGCLKNSQYKTCQTPIRYRL